MPDEAGLGLSRSLVLVFALACGLTVANLYYLQPLLPLIARELHTGAGPAGLLITSTQVGYGVGIVTLVPLGDILERRAFIPTLLGCCGLVLVGAALAPRIGVLLAIVAAVGFTSVVAQVLVPFAADLATDERRGQVVGTVMSGLLLGILLARTVSGLLAEVIGWRGVELFAAGSMVALVIVLRATLPFASRPSAHQRYRALVASVWRIFMEEPVLRLRSAYGALLFAAFSVLWTTIAFLLSRPPYDYPSWAIGLFGLVGMSGATASSLSGRLADRGHGQMVTGVTSGLLVLGFLALYPGAHDLAWLVAGMAILDFGCFGLHIANQHEIYRLRSEARSRITAVYIGTYFLGGALGSALATIAWTEHGWGGVCVLGAAFGMLAVLLWLFDTARGARRPAQAAR